MLTTQGVRAAGLPDEDGGEVVTKAQILDTVWDPAYDGDVNIVEVYVGYLRRKIDAPFGRRTIETCAASATGCTRAELLRLEATAVGTMPTW